MPKLSDLFDMRYGHSLELNRMTRAVAPAGVNFVGRTMGKNGVTARVLLPEGITAGAAGELTVALSGNGVLSTFVQPEAYLCGYHVAILSPREPTMTLREKLWWARCIYENRYRYNYGRQANRSLMDLVMPNNVPDFVALTETPDVQDESRALGPELPLPSLDSWGSWKLGEIFDIRKGRRLIQRERETGTTPFVATSTQGNGIVGHVSNEAVFPAGSVSVPYNGQGGVGYAFYQPSGYCASDDVQVLVGPSGATKAALLFVCAVIRHERYRYSFGRKWHMSRMKKTKIRLPKTSDGEPDWVFMANFIKGLRFSSGALSSAKKR
jgi:hypothetical protein